MYASERATGYTDTETGARKAREKSFSRTAPGEHGDTDLRTPGRERPPAKNFPRAGRRTFRPGPRRRLFRAREPESSSPLAARSVPRVKLAADGARGGKQTLDAPADNAVAHAPDGAGEVQRAQRRSARVEDGHADADAALSHLVV